jgi:hypothetical protein
VSPLHPVYANVQFVTSQRTDMRRCKNPRDAQWYVLSDGQCDPRRNHEANCENPMVLLGAILTVTGTRGTPADLHHWQELVLRITYPQQWLWRTIRRRRVTLPWAVQVGFHVNSMKSQVPRVCGQTSKYMRLVRQTSSCLCARGLLYPSFPSHYYLPCDSFDHRGPRSTRFVPHRHPHRRVCGRASARSPPHDYLPQDDPLVVLHDFRVIFSIKNRAGIPMPEPSPDKAQCPDERLDHDDCFVTADHLRERSVRIVWKGSSSCYAKYLRIIWMHYI